MKGNFLKSTFNGVAFTHSIANQACRLAAQSRSAFSAISELVTENRKAKAAAELYAHLSRLSDEDLAKLGISRAGIAKHIKERLYS